ncbi:glycosyltransferase family 4 protein [archaeon]|nr:glycosyltransferase family 4 protein [archaeon]
MKICLAITRLKGDLTEAISKNFYNLSQELVKQKHQVISLTPVKIQEKMNSKEIVYSQKHAYKSKAMVLKNIKRLGKIINKNHNKFDVIHIHAGFLLEAYLLNKYIKDIKTPIFITIWQPYLEIKEFLKNWKLVFKRPKDYLYHFTLNSFLPVPFFSKRVKNTNIIVSSQYQKAQLKKYIKSITVIPNGLKAPKLTTKIKQTKAPKIIYIGHFTPFKGTENLIETIRLTKKRFPQIKLTLAWSGYGSKKRIIKSLKKARLQKNIILKNKIDVHKELTNHDFLIVPYQSTIGTSHYHNVLIEAMSTGTPVLASKIGSIPELIIENKTGKFINPKKPKQIAETLIRTFKDIKLRKEISKNSIKLFKDKFLVKNITKKHLELYNEARESQELL